MTFGHSLLGLGLLSSLTQCGKKESYPTIVPIGFMLPVSIMPINSTMHLGDTLWLKADFSDSLLDRNSGRRFRVRPQDAAFNYAMLYKRLTGIGQQPVGIASTFRLVEKVGKASINGTSTGSFEPVYDGNYYHARIGLIPTQTGVTAISMLITPTGGASAIGNAIPFITLPPDSKGQSQKAVFDESFFVINDGKATNFDLYSQNTRAFSLEPGTQITQIIYEKESTFTVEVK